MPDPTPNPAEAPQRLMLPGEEEALELLDEARAEEFKPEEDRRGFSITKWADDDPVKAANLADYLIHVHGQAEDLKAQVKAIAQARRDEADAFEKTRLAHIEADQARIAMLLKVYADETYPQRTRTITLMSGELTRRGSGGLLSLTGTDQEIIDWLLEHDPDGGYDRHVKLVPKLDKTSLKGDLDKSADGSTVYKPTGEMFVAEQQGGDGGIAVEKKLAVVSPKTENFGVKPFKR